MGLCRCVVDAVESDQCPVSMSSTLVFLLRTPCWIQCERSLGTQRWCSSISIFCFSAACFVLCRHFTMSVLPQQESLQRAWCRYQGFLRSTCRFYFFLFSLQKARFQSQPLITYRALVSLLLTLKFFFPSSLLFFFQIAASQDSQWHEGILIIWTSHKCPCSYFIHLFTFS